jgi:hypothetical protein
MNLPGTIALVIALLAGFLLLLLGRSARKVGLLLLGVVICSGSFFGWQSYRYEVMYDRIETGSSQTHVQSLMGKPSQVTDCTVTYGGYRRGESEPAPPGCAEEYWYYSFFTPEAWSFSFDKEKKLVDKYHWQSP